MKQFSVVCLVIIVCCGLPYLHSDVLASHQHALLIGIQDYTYYGDSVVLSSLKGPLNDLVLVKHVLQERFGFQDEDFIILVDDEATHTGIERGFQRLIDAVEPGDFVYIHYSGHGSQTGDLQGDERSGYDQTWVSYGARRNTSQHLDGAHLDGYDILDDEINAWLSALSQKSSQIVFVSDSCHSATVSRGEAVGTRAIREDPREHPLGERQFPRFADFPGVRIGAARDYESAIEIQAENQKHYGLFTWYWAQALQQAQSGETWNDVFKRAYTRVTVQRNDVQRPQFEGDRRLRIAGGFLPMPPTVPVGDVTDGMATIQAGFLSGVTVGSVYCLYAPEHAISSETPTFTIQEVTPFVSIGQAEGPFAPGDLVVEERHAYQFPANLVYVDADYADRDRALIQAIRTAFQGDVESPASLSAYELVDNPQQAHIHVYVLHPRKEHGRYVYENAENLPASSPDQPPEVWILSPDHQLIADHLRIPFENVEDGMRIFQDNLRTLARIRELKALVSFGNMPSEVAIQVKQFSPDPSCQPGESGCIQLPEDLGTYRQRTVYAFQELEGQRVSLAELLTFTLTNTSTMTFYSYLLNISPDGKIEVLFPDLTTVAENALIEAGESRGVNNGLLTDLIGKETLKLIVSSQPIDVSLLEMVGFQQRGEPATERTRDEELNPLEQLLLHAVSGTRGLLLNYEPQRDTWSTEQVTFEVGTPDVIQ